MAAFGLDGRGADHPLAGLQSGVGREIRGGTVRLGPLGPGALAEMARQALPGYGEEEVDRLVRRLQVDSAGVPLLAHEILQAVRLGLELEDEEGAWPHPDRTLDETMPGELPDSVVAAVRVGFRELTPPARDVLTAASVLGERFEPAVLERATRLEPAELESALDELEWGRWLATEPRGYTFVARIVRDVVAEDMLTAGQRRRILQRTGSG